MLRYEVRINDDRVIDFNNSLYRDIINKYFKLGLSEKVYGLMVDTGHAFFEFDDLDKAFLFNEELSGIADKISVIDHETWKQVEPEA